MLTCQNLPRVPEVNQEVNYLNITNHKVKKKKKKTHTKKLNVVTQTGSQTVHPQGAVKIKSEINLNDKEEEILGGNLSL